MCTAEENREYVRRLRERLVHRHGGGCAFPGCGSADNLQFHHTKKTKVNGHGRGQNWRLLDVLHHPKSYALMCNNHHDFIHSQLGPDPISMKRIAQLAAAQSASLPVPSFQVNPEVMK